MTDSHDTDAHHHHTEATDEIMEARAAVLAADAKMEGLIDMLGRHFRLGVLAMVIAAIVGGAVLYLVMQLRDTQQIIEANASSINIQTVANEVEVLRHRVHSKEGDLRLCTIALGASRGIEEASRICAPVVGPDYAATKELLTKEQRRLEWLRKSRYGK